MTIFVHDFSTSQKVRISQNMYFFKFYAIEERTTFSSMFCENKNPWMHYTQ